MYSLIISHCPKRTLCSPSKEIRGLAKIVGLFKKTPDGNMYFRVCYG